MNAAKLVVWSGLEHRKGIGPLGVNEFNHKILIYLVQVDPSKILE